ncbi:hypothetical protein D3C71_828130 [compost metagenome]
MNQRTVLPNLDLRLTARNPFDDRRLSFDLQSLLGHDLHASNLRTGEDRVIKVDLTGLQYRLMTGERALGIRCQMARAGHILLPGLHLTTAHDPVSGVETNFGVGRHVAARLVAIEAVQTVDVVVEHTGNTTGLIAGKVPGSRTDRVGGNDQGKAKVCRIMFNQRLRPGAKHIETALVVYLGGGGHVQVCCIKQGAIKTHIAVSIDRHVRPSTTLTVDCKGDGVLADGEARCNQQQCGQGRINATLLQGFFVERRQQRLFDDGTRPSLDKYQRIGQPKRYLGPRAEQRRATDPNGGHGFAVTVNRYCVHGFTWGCWCVGGFRFASWLDRRLVVRHRKAVDSGRLKARLSNVACRHGNADPFSGQHVCFWQHRAASGR